MPEVPSSLGSIEETDASDENSRFRISLLASSSSSSERMLAGTERFLHQIPMPDWPPKDLLLMEDGLVFIMFNVCEETTFVMMWVVSNRTLEGFAIAGFGSTINESSTDSQDVKQFACSF